MNGYLIIFAEEERDGGFELPARRLLLRDVRSYPFLLHFCGTLFETAQSLLVFDILPVPPHWRQGTTPN